MIKKYISNFVKMRSIKNVYVTCLVTFTVIPCLILVGTVYSLSLSTIKNEYTHNYVSTLNTGYENRLNTALSHLNNFMLNLSTHQDLYLIILDDTLNEAQKSERIKKELEKILHNTHTIVGVTIKTENGQYDYLNEEIKVNCKEIDFSQKLAKSKLYIDKNRLTDGEDYYFRVGKKLFNYYNGYMVGDVIVYVSEKLFGTEVDSQNGSDNFFITVGDTIIWHKEKSEIGRTINGEEDVFAYLKIPNADKNKFFINSHIVGNTFLINDIKMVSAVSHEEVLKNMREFVARMCLLLAAFMITLFLVALRISRSLTHNIRELVIRMEDFKKNMFKNNLFKRKRKINEIARLEASFEKMLGEIRTLIVTNEENSEKRRIAELNALQSQINPHFLYNVLDTISWLAKMEKQELIEKMVTSLSVFYRMSLHNGENEIPLFDELEHVKNFLFLQEVRFPDVFRVEFDVDEEIMNSSIIKIVLQPLVENSIKHGFKSISSGGIIKITGKRDDGGYISFSVSDNGCGTNINPLQAEENEDRGYGVKNVNERLIMAYGKECGLKYNSALGEGCTVSFKIPAYNKDTGRKVVEQ